MDMDTVEGNIYYDENRKLNRYKTKPEATCHKFMVALTDYTVVTFTLWGEQCDQSKLLWKLRQVMRGNALQTYIYDDETI